MESIGFFFVIMITSMLWGWNPNPFDANRKEHFFKRDWFFYQYAVAFFALSAATDLMAEVFGLSSAYGQNVYWVALAPGIGCFIRSRLGIGRVSAES